MVRPVKGNSPEQKAMERSYSGPKCGGLRAALPVSPIWIWITYILHNIHWQSGAYDYTQLENILNVENFEHAEFFAKGSEKCKILSQILNKPVENLDNLSCPLASALVFRNEKGECDWICSSYPLRHLKTLHCAERKAYVYGLWTKTHLGL